MDMPTPATSEEMEIPVEALRQRLAELESDLEDTRRKLTEHTEAEYRYRQLIELLPDAVYLHQDGKIAYINQAGLDLLGATSPQQVIGRSTFEFIDPALRDEVRKRHRKMIETGERVPMLEQQRLRLDGSTVDVEASPMPYVWNGRPAVLVVNRDISQRKEAERALSASEEFRARAEHALAAKSALLQTTFDHMSQGISVYDGELRLVAFNQKFVELFRFPAGFIRAGGSYEEISRSMAERGYYGPGDAASQVSRRMKTARGMEIRRLERTGPDGTTLAVWRNPLPDGGFVTTFTDISERKRAEEVGEELNRKLTEQAEELKRSNAELEQFAYVASHDLQEPLRMVSSYCQLLQKRYADKLDEDANEFIQFAVEGAARMRHLINDLLRYSRVGTRGKPLQAIRCDQVVAEALANLSVAIEESGARITTGELPVVMGDPTQLVQLFQNLIGNAIKFRADRRPEIHIDAAPDGGDRVFSVRDNGIGIEMEFADRIFLIFQRLHNRTEYPGTGIGLALCKKIVVRHGGEIQVCSQPGTGSTFTFNLPGAEI